MDFLLKFYKGQHFIYFKIVRRSMTGTGYKIKTIKRCLQAIYSRVRKSALFQGVLFRQTAT